MRPIHHLLEFQQTVLTSINFERPFHYTQLFKNSEKITVYGLSLLTDFAASIVVYNGAWRL